MKNFLYGVITGFAVTLIIYGVITGLNYLHEREGKLSSKEVIEYAEKIQAIEQLWEDYANTNPDEFLDVIPDVRRTADGAAAEFERKRDEALYRFRNRLVN